MGVEVQPHCFLTSVSKGREYSTSRVDQFNRRKKSLEPMRVAKWAQSPSDSLDKQKSLLPPDGNRILDDKFRRIATVMTELALLA